MRRPLSETLLDLLGSVTSTPTAMFRVSGVYLDLPLEIRVRFTEAGVEVLADAPSWRWQTEFNEPRSRVRITCQEGVPE
jgi:hypothetical protein